MDISFPPCRLAAALAAAFVLQASPPAMSADATPAAPVLPAAAACLKPGAWARLGGEGPRPATVRDILPPLAERDVVLLGEQHDKADDHRWQLQTLAALHALRPAMAIGFEAFPRRVQPVLDRWVAGELTTAEFLEQVEWNAVWGLPAELYLPLFEFARLNRIPMLALNVDRKLIRKVATEGGAAVPDAEREGVSRPAAPPPPYLDQLFGVHREHARMRGATAPAKRDDADFRNFVDAQTTWDRAMAEALTRRLGGTEPRPLVVGIVGSGHLRDGHGIAHQLRDLGVTRIATLLPVAADTPCAELRPGLADAVFALPPQASTRAEPPRLGVTLGESDGERGVRVAEVMPGSLAERSGIRSGDLLVELAGAPVGQMAAVVAAVRSQPAGTWLPLRIRRGGELLDIVVRFPARG